MKYFKNTEVAAIYHVSEKSVRNWIAGALSGARDLELIEHNGRHYIANTTKNDVAIKKFVDRGQKYINSRGRKTVRPNSTFYKLYGPEQIYDMFAHIDAHRSIPLQYTYFNGGAHLWDDFAKNLAQEEASNILKSTVELLRLNRAYVAHLAKNYKRINVVDLGIGNAYPVREFLSFLLEEGLKVRYIGVDTSEEMLRIADANIKEWFGDKLVFEKHMLDISREQFGRIVADDAFNGDDSVLNMVLLLGGTLTNFRAPKYALQLAASSMGRHDIMIFATKLDSANARRYFNFYKPDDKSLSARHRAIPDMLNINRDLYSVEQYFDEQKMTRFISIKLKVDLTIEFEIAGRPKSVSIDKGESIVLWRSLHQTDFEVITTFNANGFDLLHASKTPDQEYILTISKVKNEIPEIL